MVEVSTKGWDALERRLGALDGLQLRLGIMGPDGGPTGPHPNGDGLSIADIATIHEHGTDDVPQRSIVRGYLAEGGESELARDIAAVAEQVADGADPEAALQAVGDKHAAKMRARFDRGIGPAIEDEDDDSDPRPLHDTGAIGRSIRAHVDGGR